MNLIAGLLYLAALKGSRFRSGATRYFLWLSASVNLLQAGGYLMVSPLAGFGDWTAFVAELNNVIVWKLTLTALGVAISLFGLRMCFRYLQPFLPERKPERVKLGTSLTVIPYLTGCVVIIASAVRSGGGVFLILFSAAAATLMGTCWIVWAPWAPGVLRGTDAKHEGDPLIVRRSYALILLATASALYCIWKLGPGVVLTFQTG